MDEIFKDVVGFESYFKVSNLGKVFSKRSNKILKTFISKKGYERLATKINGINKCFVIHRLVAITFIPNTHNKPEVNHIDGNKCNNIVEKLEWVTTSENAIHAYTTGLKYAKGGVDNVNSKLSHEDILEIRCSAGTCRELAERYGVHHMQISRIKRNIAYKNAGVV